MINNVKVGDRVFVVYDRYPENSGGEFEICAEDLTTLIFEDRVLAIIDFGVVKRIALKSDVSRLDNDLEHDIYKIFTDYDDALEYAKNCVYKHFIEDKTKIKK